jgi:hypothetical protein
MFGKYFLISSIAKDGPATFAVTLRKAPDGGVLAFF